MLAMSGHGILKQFRPIKKDPPVDKNPHEDKVLPNPSGPLLKVIPSSSIRLPAVTLKCMTEVMKQAKRLVTKSGYTKLTAAQRYEIGRKGAEIGVTAAIRYYKKFSDLSLSKPTVRQLKNLYLKE